MAQQDLFRQAAQQVSADFEFRRAGEDQEVLDQARDLSLMPDFVDNVQQSIGGGAAKALFEAKDFLVGEPEEGEKSGLRRSIEAQDRALDRESVGWGLTSGISQFVTGMIGVGKVAAPLKGVQKLKQAGKAGRIAYETARGAAASAIVIDPHEERLSDLVQEFPALENPVTEYLSSDPADSTAEGRLKNALEGIGLDLGLVGVFSLAAKSLKLAKAGKHEEAIKVAQQAEKAEVERVAVPEVWEHSGPVKDVRAAEAAAVQTKQTDEALGHSLEEGVELNRNLPEVWWRSKVADDAARTRGDGQVVEPEGNPAGQAPMEVTVKVRPDGQPSDGLPTPGPAPKVETSSAPTGGGSPTFELTTTTKLQSRRPQMRVEEPDVEAILQGAAKDIEALAEHGSRDAAVSAGYKFGGEGVLPWNKLRATDTVRSMVDSAAATLKSQMDAKKGGGVLKDARVQTMIRARAEAFNEDPEIIMGSLLKAGDQAKTLVANMEAAYLISNKMLQDTYDTAMKVRNGILDEWGGDAAIAAAELKARMSAAMDLLAAAKSMSSNSGRSLRRMRTEFQIKPEDIEKVQSMDGQQLADLIYRTGGNPKKLHQVVNPDFLTRAMEEVQFSLTNSLLWLYPTHVVNISSNLYMLAARPTEKLFGSLAQRGGGGVRRQALKEYSYTVASMGDAWDAAVEAFKKGDSILSPHGEEYFDVGHVNTRGAPIQWKPIKGIGDVLHNALLSANYRTIVGFPTRALGTVDEFVKNMRYRAVVQARASVEANDAGLSGDDFKRYVQRSLEEAFDMSGRGIDPAALREAQTVTFQNDLDYPTVPFAPIGRTIRNARANAPVLGLILPFVRTPINVLRYAWKMTPGLNMLQKEFQQNIRGVNGTEAQAHAVGQMTLGSLYMGIAASMAFSGQITGGGPSDVRLKRELVDSGWKPYSFVQENGDGTRSYFPIGRFDPVGMPFGMVADLVDLMVLHPESKEAEEGLGALAIALAQNFSERTFLLNINQFMRAASDPGKQMEKYIGTLAGNAMPLSSLMRGTNPDPYLRDARGIIDNALRNVPGYSDTLPPVRDAFGEPVWRRVGLTTTQEADLVEAEHNRIILETGYGISRPAPTRSGVDLRDLVLEDGKTAYDRLQELSMKPGKTRSLGLKEALARLIQSEDYAMLPDGDSGTRGTKLYALSGVVSEFRQAAFKRLRAESKILRDAMSQRQIEARAEFQRNKSDRQSADPGARELLEMLGY